MMKWISIFVLLLSMKNMPSAFGWPACNAIDVAYDLLSQSRDFKTWDVLLHYLQIDKIADKKFKALIIQKILALGEIERKELLGKLVSANVRESYKLVRKMVEDMISHKFNMSSAQYRTELFAEAYFYAGPLDSPNVRESLLVRIGAILKEQPYANLNLSTELVVADYILANKMFGSSVTLEELAKTILTQPSEKVSQLLRSQISIRQNVIDSTKLWNPQNVLLARFPQVRESHERALYDQFVSARSERIIETKADLDIVLRYKDVDSHIMRGNYARVLGEANVTDARIDQAFLDLKMRNKKDFPNATPENVVLEKRDGMFLPSLEYICIYDLEASILVRRLKGLSSLNPDFSYVVKAIEYSDFSMMRNLVAAIYLRDVNALRRDPIVNEGLNKIVEVFRTKATARENLTRFRSSSAPGESVAHWQYFWEHVLNRM